MDRFFLLFDVTVDISHNKFISGKYRHTHQANLPHSKRIIYLGKSVLCNRISYFQQRGFLREIYPREITKSQLKSPNRTPQR